MKSLYVWPVLAFAIAACSTEGYRPYASTPGEVNPNAEKHDQFTLQRTACFGFCPVYKVNVDDRDLVSFQGERFVTEAGGAVSKRLPKGSFKKLVEIAQAYDFSSFDAAYPNQDGSNCPQRATDMPSVIVSFEAKKVSHSVSVYQGCMGFDGRERFDEMVVKLDAVLDLDDMIGPREDFYGAKE